MHGADTAPYSFDQLIPLNQQGKRNSRGIPWPSTTNTFCGFFLSLGSCRSTWRSQKYVDVEPTNRMFYKQPTRPHLHVEFRKWDSQPHLRTLFLPVAHSHSTACGQPHQTAACACAAMLMRLRVKRCRRCSEALPCGMTTVALAAPCAWST